MPLHNYKLQPSCAADTDGGTTTYSYDGRDMLTSQVLPTGEIYTLQYDAVGNQTTVTFGNGSIRSTIDALGQVITLTALTGATIISTIVDTYDNDGRKTRQSRDGVVTTYTYDNADRLTGQQVTGARATFVYDTVGNMTVKHHQGSLPLTMTYDAAQRLTTLQDGPTRVTFSYDNNGNTTVENRGGVSTNYTYNRRNRESVIVNSDGTRETMTYDGDGLRRRKQTASGVTTYVWDGGDYLGEVF